VQLEAVKRHEYLIQLIKNPTERVIALYEQLTGKKYVRASKYIQILKLAKVYTQMSTNSIHSYIDQL